MEIIEQLGLALGFASLAGLNLYLTVFLAGIAVRFQWVELAEQHMALATLGNDWVLGVAGVLFLIEFFADKVPWVDSTWDSIHTVIRPAGGIMLALAALGKMDPSITVIAAMLAGGTSLLTHSAKAGMRLVTNLIPEPTTNTATSVGASVAEDTIVIGGLSLMALNPAIAFFAFLALVIFALFLSRFAYSQLKKVGASCKQLCKRLKWAG
ncbi:DUF4126 domain-containing protein [Persicirhabdus sediminis]|uniref:DUF4126 domain-containing protein n=1 Tax=Persicirhabdus sediminis TaxID=454144 RepID=A0A8J7SIT7_9BACT|nr:DUF4126 domain-containing protein [Persicirhabdus sediminis]MBK1790676.1 DUF4126 domain-containing protein [Persicirhabdus sediminis]